jgi:hypothetical protein
MLFFHVNGFVEFLTWFQYEKKVFKFEFDLNSAIIFLIQAYQDELKEKYGVPKLAKNLSGMFSGLATGSGVGISTGGGLFGLTAPATGTELFGAPTTGAGLFGTPATGFGSPFPFGKPKGGGVKFGKLGASKLKRTALKTATAKTKTSKKSTKGGKSKEKEKVYSSQVYRDMGVNEEKKNQFYIWKTN